MDLGNDFVTHGKQQDLYKHCGLDSDGIAEKIQEVLCFEN
jgi:deoxyxylulose-5-phosphate synthase